MTVPSVASIIDSNKQLVGIQALGLSAPDEAAFKALLVAVYQQTINDYTGAGSINPAFAQVLQAELTLLQTLTTAQLAALPVRGP